jgi:hypothetical protein
VYSGRWNHCLNASIVRVSGRTGTCGEDKDIKLDDAVQTHGAKKWLAIATLVPGRKEGPCRTRWKDVLDPTIDRANACTYGYGYVLVLVLKRRRYQAEGCSANARWQELRYKKGSCGKYFGRWERRMPA